MAETYLPFDSQGGDTRQYSATQWRDMQKTFFTNGVFFGIDNELAVTIGTGVSLDVATGRGMVEGAWYKNDAVLNKTGTAADPTNPRIDRFVLELDTASGVRTVIAKIVAGTPAGSPSAPALTRSGTIYQISLAQARINAGSAAYNTITDERYDGSVCGTAGPRWGWRLVKVSKVESNAYTATTDGDMVGGAAVITGLSIAASKRLKIQVQYRKTSGAASAVGLGLKLNTTVVVNARASGANALGVTSATNQAEDGMAEATFLPSDITNFTRPAFGHCATQGIADAMRPQADAARPNATLTDITIRGISATSVSLFVGAIYIYEADY